MNASTEQLTHDPTACSKPDLETMDVLVLEQALRETSQGTMAAPLREVYRRAVEKWGYPETIGAAKALLLQTGRYELVNDWSAGCLVVRHTQYG